MLLCRVTALPPQPDNEALQTSQGAGADINSLPAQRSVLVCTDKLQEAESRTVAGQVQLQHQVLDPEKTATDVEALSDEPRQPDQQAFDLAIVNPSSNFTDFHSAELDQAAADNVSNAVSSQSNNQLGASNSHAGNLQASDKAHNAPPGALQDASQHTAAPPGVLNQQESFASNTTPSETEESTEASDNDEEIILDANEAAAAMHDSTAFGTEGIDKAGLSKANIGPITENPAKDEDTAEVNSPLKSPGRSPVRQLFADVNNSSSATSNMTSSTTDASSTSWDQQATSLDNEKSLVSASAWSDAEYEIGEAPDSTCNVEADAGNTDPNIVPSDDVAERKSPKEEPVAVQTKIFVSITGAALSFTMLASVVLTSTHR